MVATTDRNGVVSSNNGGFLLPHQRTFSSIFNSYIKGYRSTWDEAIKHSRTNALAMRRDAFILGCLQERYLQVAQLKWHLEPEDQRDPVQKEVAQELTKVIQATKAWHHFTMQLAEAIWYGRFGNQLRWDVKSVAGKKRLVIGDHRPVNGDKIQYGYDGVPRVMINWEQVSAMRERGAVIEEPESGPPAPGTSGHAISASDAGAPLLVLDDPRWRQRFVIHKHLPQDADFFDGEMAGGIHGVGLRHQIYWLWFLRDDFLGTMLNYMEKLGVGGILIFPYAEGNDESKKAAEANAQDVGSRQAMTMPVREGSGKGSPLEPILLQFNDAGVRAMKELVDDYFERHIERLIIGQTLSSKPSGGGELGSGASSFQKDTKFRILTYDALNMGDTLSSDLVEVSQRWNFPKADFRIRFVFDIPDPGAGDKLKGAELLHKMKVPMKADEVRGAAGLSKPEADDETVYDNSAELQAAAQGAPGGVPPGSAPQPGAQAAQDVPPAPTAGQAPALPGAEHLPPHGAPTIPGQEHLAADGGAQSAQSAPEPPAIPGQEHIGAKVIPGQELLKDVGQAPEPVEDGQPTIPGAELLGEAGAEPVRAPDTPVIPGAEHIGQKIIPGQELLSGQVNKESALTGADQPPTIPGAEHLGDSPDDDTHAAALELAKALLEGDDSTGAPAMVNSMDSPPEVDPADVARIAPGALWIAEQIQDESERVEALADEVMRLLEESQA